MKKQIFALSASLLAAGCTLTESGRVTTTPDGTKVYGLDEQPQSNVAGVGPLMAPGQDPARVQPGQFTGKEDASDRIGQYPVTPRESTGEEFRRDSTDTVTRQGTGAGTLGQVGIRPGPVSAAAILSNPVQPEPGSAGGGVNPPAMSAAPTLAEPLTEGASNERVPRAMGGLTGVEQGQRTSDNSVRLPSAGGSAVGLPAAMGPDATTAGVADLPSRIREALGSGTPGTITRLDADRLTDIDIEALNGNVTLRGNAQSETERLMIGNRVARMPGVKSVNNQLQVTNPTRKEMNDQSTPEARSEAVEP